MLFTTFSLLCYSRLPGPQAAAVRQDGGRGVDPADPRSRTGALHLTSAGHAERGWTHRATNARLQVKDEDRSAGSRTSALTSRRLGLRIGLGAYLVALALALPACASPGRSSGDDSAL